MREVIQAIDRFHLLELIDRHIQAEGPHCDLNHIDVSEVISLHRLFDKFPQFNGDISKWNTSNVLSLGWTFSECAFNGDISQWDTSKVTDMTGTFYKSAFNGDISQWDTSSVEDMSHCFQDSVFTGDLSLWNTSNVMNLNGMFQSSPFNGDISKWDTSKVTNFHYIFNHSAFRGDISQWELHPEGDIAMPFSEYHESPLGIVSVLGEYQGFPPNDPRAARFQALRSLCDGLGLDRVSAAQYIYRGLRDPELLIDDQVWPDFSTH